ncbi:hypothetical protein POX_b02498 [Penicillium oxalicum]|uniref:hypothetical protein n=1 Tax=Penicillium oxalicum TaxID=69781 RepID=UPI0020B8C96C|nr:hypothetical protein POX_b02498 [Penicillium oxalicum]KAI2792460.1 hypothetical protein POX_b02498 [Penicillium oxalicum]
MALYHQTVDFFSESWANQRTQLPLLAVTGASFTLGLLLRSLLKGDKHKGAILASPRTRVLSHLSEEEKRQLPLPDDVLPGARDVASPYGSIRVYEWGREDGPKVLLVHGITTPCIALGGVAHALVDRGCRVMLFDLFGRGYSDCPSDMPQDERLFATQVMLALTTSPISWTGTSSGKFSLVGYSLGGGIAAAFASFFPQLLSSLVLLAPAGLVRDSQISFQGRLLYSGGLMPEGLLSFLVSRRLKSGRLIAPKKDKQGKLNAQDALTEEMPSDDAAADQVLSREYPHVTVPSAVAWQVHHHAGFVHSFMSSMRHGPILGSRQKVHWARLGEYLSAQNSNGAGDGREKGLPSHKVHILCGNTDTIIIKDELVSDAAAVLGGNVVFKFYDAGHEFPSTKYEEVAAYIEKVL